MFHITTCPTCQTRFSIPEGNVGKRQVCPHCQSPFVAGKSVAEDAGPQADNGPAKAPLMAPTMLGEMEATIKYNCPRCKKQLEAPASEAGQKKPCPGCGQRLQVPAAPPPAAAAGTDPALNKTLLAEEVGKPAAPPIQYNCPNCKKPLESPASEGGQKKNCPYCSQRLQIPKASPAPAGNPNLQKTLLAEETGGGPVPATSSPAAGGASAPTTAPAAKGIFSSTGMRIGAGIAALLLLGVIGLAVTAPGAGAAREKFEKAQADLQKMISDYETKRAALDKEQALANQRNLEMLKQFEAQQAALIKSFEDKKQELLDERKAAAAKAERDEQMRKIAKEREDAERRYQQQQDQHKAQMDLLQAQIKQTNEKQTTIIQQPAPFYYRYHPWYGWGY